MDSGGDALRTSAPTSQELPRLHQELGIWIANTRYKMENSDRVHIWKVQNTSMVIATGVGVGAYLLLKRFQPAIKFPWDTVPTFAAFYLTNRVSDAVQMPGLYNTFVRSPSPLGDRARDILQAIRNKGRLPSDEFGWKLPRGVAATVPATPAAPMESAVQPLETTTSAPWGTNPGTSSQNEVSSSQWGTATSGTGASTEAQWGRSTSGTSAATEAPPALSPDPWGEASPRTLGVEDGGLGEGWGSSSSEEHSRPVRKTWDEIRARQQAGTGPGQQA